MVDSYPSKALLVEQKQHCLKINNSLGELVIRLIKHFMVIRQQVVRVINYSLIDRLIQHAGKLLEEKEEKLCLKLLQTLKEMMTLEPDTFVKVVFHIVVIAFHIIIIIFSYHYHLFSHCYHCIFTKSLVCIKLNDAQLSFILLFMYSN